MHPRLLLAALVAASLPSAPATASATVVATGHAVRHPVDVRTAVGTCVAAAVGDALLTVFTECGFSDDPTGFTPAFVGPVAVATFTGGFGETPKSLCWAGYVVPATDASALVPFDGCTTIAP